MRNILPVVISGILLLSSIGAVAIADNEIMTPHKKAINPVIVDNLYDMVIIAPSTFSDELQPLIDHKNAYELNTTFKSTEEIYSEYDGLDEAEEIKYFIKDAIEILGVEYVLLVGSIDKLPIRTSHAGFWGENGVLTDLYYADIYDENGSFCSWDGNGNGIYGEVYHDHHQTYDIDGVDLFPDVNLGRLACVNKGEVNTVVEKIIQYETNTFGKSWFNNILLIGGDTFPDSPGYEGEEKNELTEQIMSDFNPIQLKTSDGTFTSWAVNRELNAGVGFVDYSGHGFELGLATHPPNDESTWVRYNVFNLPALLNRDKLPIVFLDACLTAKLDYNVSELSISTGEVVSQIPSPYEPTTLRSSLFSTRLSPLAMFAKKSSLGDTLVPCFAWRLVSKGNGGAIATIGATRTAFGGINSGAGKISLEFFEAYANSETVGQMMSQAQCAYIEDVHDDLFTVEEFILLGDPSLKIGGYETSGGSGNIIVSGNQMNNELTGMVTNPLAQPMQLISKTAKTSMQ